MSDEMRRIPFEADTNDVSTILSALTLMEAVHRFQGTPKDQIQREFHDRVQSVLRRLHDSVGLPEKMRMQARQMADKAVLSLADFMVERRQVN